MAAIPFLKATACGNDFLIIDAARAPLEKQDFTRRICHRHNGVGADGVEWTVPASDADIGVQLLNADGSEAEISGNGTRCVAAWYVAENGRNRVTIRTGAGVKTCELVARRGQSFEFRSAMGQPVVGPELSVRVEGAEVRGRQVSMGNPHFIVFTSEFSLNWQEVGRQIATHSNFKEGTNVEFVRMLNEHEIEARFYERGVGETLSSGTGSCAAAVASIHSQKVGSPVRVHAPGGTQMVEWIDQVFLTGPATLLCRGEFFI